MRETEAVTLPLACRLLGHSWKPSRLWHPTHTAAWQRQTCRRCAGLEVPTPPDEAHPERRPRPA